MSRPKLVQRLRARELARDAWIQSAGDKVKAEEILRASIDPATILFFLQIAMQLWKWWSEHNVSEPSVTASADEPIDLEADDDG